MRGFTKVHAPPTFIDKINQAWTTIHNCFLVGAHTPLIGCVRLLHFKLDWNFGVIVRRVSRTPMSNHSFINRFRNVHLVCHVDRSKSHVHTPTPFHYYQPTSKISIKFPLNQLPKPLLPPLILYYGPPLFANVCICVCVIITEWKFSKSIFEATTTGSKWDNRSHSYHRRKCLLDCFGGQLDANTRISTGYSMPKISLITGTRCLPKP